MAARTIFDLESGFGDVFDQLSASVWKQKAKNRIVRIWCPGCIKRCEFREEIEEAMSVHSLQHAVNAWNRKVRRVGLSDYVFRYA